MVYDLGANIISLANKSMRELVNYDIAADSNKNILQATSFDSNCGMYPGIQSQLQLFKLSAKSSNAEDLYNE